MRSAATFCLGVLIAAPACARAASAQGSLEAAVGRYSAQAARALGKEAGEGYAESGRRTLRGDVDRDGDADAVVELSFCEARRCDPLTQTSHLAVFLKGRGGYRLAAGMGFLKFNEDNSTEAVGRVESVRGGKIRVAVYGCEVDDEVCRHKYLYSAVYSLRRGRLVRERAYVRGAG